MSVRGGVEAKQHLLLVAQGAAQSGVRCFPDQLFHCGLGLWRDLEAGARPLQDRLGEIVGRHNLSGDAQRVSALGIDPPARQHDVGRHIFANGPRQSLRTAAAGRQPEPALRQTKLRCGGYDDDVATQGNLETTAECETIDRANRWLGHLLQFVEHAARIRLVSDEGGAPVALVLGNIRTGNKGTIARTAEHQNANRRILGRLVERFVKVRHKWRG